MSLRVALLVPGMLALAACVTFERTPVATLDCDPALAGHWRPVADGAPDRPVDIAADCTMRWPEDDGGTFVTTLAGFALDGERYLVFSPAAADRLINEHGQLEAQVPKHDVLLVRYRIEGDRATVWLADTREAARPADAGMAQGRKAGDDLVRVRGQRAAIRRLLQARGTRIFAGKDDGMGTMQFVRIEGTTP